MENLESAVKEHLLKKGFEEPYIHYGLNKKDESCPYVVSKLGNKYIEFPKARNITRAWREAAKELGLEVKELLPLFIYEVTNKETFIEDGDFTACIVIAENEDHAKEIVQHEINECEVEQVGLGDLNRIEGIVIARKKERSY